MTDPRLTQAEAALTDARMALWDEMRAYPTPVSGCDAQYNHLIGLRAAVDAALDALGHMPFVPTPRSPSPEAGVESR